MIHTSVMGMTGQAENVQRGRLGGAIWLGCPRLGPQLRCLLTYQLSPATHKIGYPRLFQVLLSNPHELWCARHDIADFVIVRNGIVVVSEC